MSECDWQEVRDELLASPAVREEFERDAIAHAVALWLLRYRAEQGWSRREMARRIGVRTAVLARLEAGESEPKLSTLLRLATALSTSVELLVGGRSVTISDEEAQAA